MNRLAGVITDIETSNELSIVSVKVGIHMISSIIIETPETASYLQLQQPIDVLFKETEVSIGKNLSGELSIESKLPCIVNSIEVGILLSKVKLGFNGEYIWSIVTTNSLNQLGLKINDQVLAMIKTNEIMLAT